MLELPEVVSRARELNAALAGKVVSEVLPPSSPHKFCWFSGSAEDYHARFAGQTFQGAEGFGIFVELAFSGGARLCVNDGVNLRFLEPDEKRPAKYQMMMNFLGGASLVFTVAMYGGIYAHDGGLDSEYYLASRARVSPLSDAFTPGYFHDLISSVKPTASVKALLATQQHIPGLGNGVLQDILLAARIHPKRKIASLTPAEITALYEAVRAVLREMTQRGGRDTERTLFGQPGGYKTRMCKDTLKTGCPVCGGPVTKESYMGGAVYACAACQPLKQ